jgi:hypothetical protein
MDILSNASIAGGVASIAPNYVDGTMFANDNELYLYGLASLVSPSNKSLILRSFIAEACFIIPIVPILRLLIKSCRTRRTSMGHIEAYGSPPGTKNTSPLMLHDISPMALLHQPQERT